MMTRNKKKAGRGYTREDWHTIQSVKIYLPRFIEMVNSTVEPYHLIQLSRIQKSCINRNYQEEVLANEQSVQDLEDHQQRLEQT